MDSLGAAKSLQRPAGAEMLHDHYRSIFLHVPSGRRQCGDVYTCAGISKLVKGQAVSDFP